MYSKFVTILVGPTVALSDTNNVDSFALNKVVHLCIDLHYCVLNTHTMVINATYSQSIMFHYSLICTYIPMSSFLKCLRSYFSNSSVLKIVALYFYALSLSYLVVNHFVV